MKISSRRLRGRGRLSCLENSEALRCLWSLDFLYDARTHRLMAGVPKKLGPIELSAVKERLFDPLVQIVRETKLNPKHPKTPQGPTVLSMTCRFFLRDNSIIRQFLKKNLNL